jgi:hypothetical protein
LSCKLDAKALKSSGSSSFPSKPARAISASIQEAFAGVLSEEVVLDVDEDAGGREVVSALDEESTTVGEEEETVEIVVEELLVEVLLFVGGVV